MSRPQNDVDADESSGVTILQPVPAKPARLLGLSESDSTHYFSATELLERGKALAAHTSEPIPSPAQQARSAPETPRRGPGWLEQLREASLGRKLSALLLLLACVILLARPVLKKAEHHVASKPKAAVAVPTIATEPKRAVAAPSATASAFALPRGVTLAHAAVDSVATGDFSRATTLYRELSRREPTNQAYGVAARILSERAQARTP